jgi:hypothetical protein
MYALGSSVFGLAGSTARWLFAGQATLPGTAVKHTGV